MLSMRTALTALAGATALMGSALAQSFTLKNDWEAFSVPLTKPAIIDMTKGGHIDMQIGQAKHNWTEDGSLQGDIYGYALKNATPTFPGPTIVVAKGVPIDVTWHNTIHGEHILNERVEKTLTLGASECYPYCGVPVVVHVHGLESPARYDGLPSQSVYENQSQTAHYLNNQSASTKMYHDHAMGLTRLNTWAGLMGAYIIKDDKLEKSLNVSIDPDWDIPLIITDRMINDKGKIVYSDDMCADDPVSKWIPESFGTHNVVNGKVMPYIEVPSAQVRFRLVNVANARHYNFSIPFADKCKIIAKDSGFVQKVEKIPDDGYMLYPFQRTEMICDFSDVKVNTSYNVTDRPDEIGQKVYEFDYDPRVFQVRVNTKLKGAAPLVVPDNLVKLKDLKTLWKEMGGKERSLMLGEIEFKLGCPSQSLLLYKNQIMNTTNMGTMHCTRGRVEKWFFKNPTDDPHPFHWHLVNAQCGEDDEHVDTNAMRDVVVIPNAGTRAKTTITQVCYVACTPDEFLIENSTRGPAEYNFDTTEPYVAHCHIVEHEENAMMSWFRLTDTDDGDKNDNGYVPDPNKVTGEIIGTAMGMSVLGGLATCFSILVISVPSLNFLASRRSLSFSFALAAGVMIFISLSDLIPESITFFRAHFTVGGSVDPEAYEKGGAAASMGVCDNTCNGNAWLSAIACFYGGLFVIIAVEWIVHKCLERAGHRHSGCDSDDDIPAAKSPVPIGKTPAAAPAADDAEKGITTSSIQIASPVPGTPTATNPVPLQSPTSGEGSTLVGVGGTDDVDGGKNEFKRAGMMTGIALAIHNFPEGLALFVSSLGGLRSGIILSIGIILHNMPEGVAVAAPVYYATGSKLEAFKWTGLSGVALPFGAAIGWAAVSGGLSAGLQAVLYGLVAGMLMGITAMELIPGVFKFDPKGKVWVSGLFIGFGIIAVSLIALHYAGSG
ncbi:TPA: hypothetical protein N0F65_006782 [Lagenidium giganteum]|uniref:Uncharacterized protein n=1 Tax=Lagenidium giganteum TaxID=4803 RepID=A0AAV2ZEP7_9STRA|nr:TPA: hypothetical protein N0F65_006782 [Lagenidium giganteum]